MTIRYLAITVERTQTTTVHVRLDDAHVPLGEPGQHGELDRRSRQLREIAEEAARHVSASDWDSDDIAVDWAAEMTEAERKAYSLDLDASLWRWPICPDCQGTGRSVSEELRVLPPACRACQGRGHLPAERGASQP